MTGPTKVYVKKFENLAMIGWHDAGNNLKTSIKYWWKIWTFDSPIQKSYYSLKAKSIKVSLIKYFSCMRWAAILHHYDDNVDLLCYCNVLLSLFSVSGFPSFKEHKFEGTPFSDCFQIYIAFAIWKLRLRNLHYTNFVL